MPHKETVKVVNGSSMNTITPMACGYLVGVHGKYDCIISKIAYSIFEKCITPNTCNSIGLPYSNHKKHSSSAQSCTLLECWQGGQSLWSLLG